MQIHERGVLSTSTRYFFTPSALARELLYYPKRLGHYFCTADYRFDCRHEIAQQGDHNLNFMVFAIRSGMLRLELGGRGYQAGAGQLCVFDCRQPYAYQAEENTEFLWLLCNGLNTADLYAHIQRTQGNILPYSSYLQAENALSRLADRCSEELRPTEPEISQLLHSLWCGLLVRRAAPQDAAGSPIVRALQHIDRHYDQPLHVDRLAALCSMSPSHFSRTFRQYTGHSPYEYLLLRRINCAKRLLVESDMTVEEIAYAAGYTAPEHFIHSFRSKVGQSPGHFRTAERSRSR